jgi:hypothetical protein
VYRASVPPAPARTQCSLLKTTEQRSLAHPTPPGSRHQEKLAELGVFIVVVFIVVVPDILFCAIPSGQADAGNNPTRTATRRRQEKQPAKLLIVVFVFIVVDVCLTAPARSDAENCRPAPPAPGRRQQQQLAELRIFAVIVVFVIVFDIEVLVAQFFRDGQLSDSFAAAHSSR